MTRMHNPPHPGEILREYLGDITVTQAAVKLGVNRVTLSRVVTGSSGISADMAYRLGEAFGTNRRQSMKEKSSAGSMGCHFRARKVWRGCSTR